MLSKVHSGESKLVNPEVVRKWKEVDIKKLLEAYEMHNIMNYDEAGYFFRDLPTRSMAYANEEAKGGKRCMDRVT